MNLIERGFTMILQIGEALLGIILIVTLNFRLKKIGFLHQLKFKPPISLDIQVCQKWSCKTFSIWKYEKYSFLSADSIRETIWKLEREGYIVLT